MIEKGLGIGALVLSIVAIFVPAGGPWLTVVAALIAAFAYGPGFGIAIGAIVVNVLNLLFLTPTTWIYWSGGIEQGAVIPFIWFGAQVVGLVILLKRNSRFKTADAAVSSQETK